MSVVGRALTGWKPADFTGAAGVLNRGVYYWGIAAIPGLAWTAARKLLTSTSWCFTWLPKDPKIQLLFDWFLLGSSFLSVIKVWYSGSSKLKDLLQKEKQNQPLSSEDFKQVWDQPDCRREIVGKLDVCNFPQLALIWDDLTEVEKRSLTEKLFGKTQETWAALSQLINTLKEFSSLDDCSSIEGFLLDNDMIKVLKQLPEFWLATRSSLYRRYEATGNDDFWILVFKISIKLHREDLPVPDFNKESQKVTLEICQKQKESNEIEVVDKIEGIYTKMLTAAQGSHQHIHLRIVEEEGNSTKRRIIIGNESPVLPKNIKKMIEFFARGEQPPIKWLLKHLQMLDMFGMESFLYIVHRFLAQHHDKLDAMGTGFSQEEIAKMLIDTHPANIKKLEKTWSDCGPKALAPTNILFAMSYATIFGLTGLGQRVKTYIQQIKDPQVFMSVFNHIYIVQQKFEENEKSERVGMVTEWEEACQAQAGAVNVHTSWKNLFEMPPFIMKMLVTRDHSYINLDKEDLTLPSGRLIGFTNDQVIKTLRAMEKVEETEVIEIQEFLASSPCLELMKKVPRFLDHVYQTLVKRGDGIHLYQLQIQYCTWRVYYPLQCAAVDFVDKTQYISLKIQQGDKEAVTIDNIPDGVLKNAGLEWKLDSKGERILALQEGQNLERAEDLIKKLVASERPTLSWLVENYVLINQLKCKSFLWELQRILMQPDNNAVYNQEDLQKIARLFVMEPPFITEGWECGLQINEDNLLILMSLASITKSKEIMVPCFSFAIYDFLPWVAPSVRMPQKYVGIKKVKDRALFFKEVYEHAVHLKDRTFIDACIDIAVLEKENPFGSTVQTLSSAWFSLLSIPKELFSAVHGAETYRLKVYTNALRRANKVSDGMTALPAAPFSF